MLAVLFVSQVMFLSYGAMISSLPVALTNGFTTLFVGILILLKWRYG
jgi:uncharacterized protein with PQ loop repeat